jgi:Co/Zn/Cd efflux system component
MIALDTNIALTLIIIGIITAFIGKKLLRIGIGLIGGAVLAYVTYEVAVKMGVSTTPTLVLAALAFIIGYFLAWFIVKLAVAVLAGIALGLGLAVVLGLSGNLPMLILTVLITIALVYLLADKLIGIAVTLAGVLIFFIGVDYFTGGVVATVISFIFFVLVAWWKLKKR